MPTVFIADMAVSLPSRFTAGDAINASAAAVLNDIQHRRIKARLRYLMERGELAQEELQAKADELMTADLSPGATLDDDDNVDPVMEEALNIARELIIGRMAREGLPPPKGLDIHAKALVNAMPDIQAKARHRIEARYRAANALLA